jgi:hypothetical protein
MTPAPAQQTEDRDKDEYINLGSSRSFESLFMDMCLGHASAIAEHVVPERPRNQHEGSALGIYNRCKGRLPRSTSCLEDYEMLSLYKRPSPHASTSHSEEDNSNLFTTTTTKHRPHIRQRTNLFEKLKDTSLTHAKGNWMFGSHGPAMQYHMEVFLFLRKHRAR